MNCLLLISDAVSDVDNEYPKFLVETTPATIAVMLASNENAVFPPCVADVGIGAKQLALSILTFAVSKSIPL